LPPNKDIYTLKLVRRDNHIALQYKGDIDIAVLNTKTTNVLWAVEELRDVRYEVFVGVETFSTGIITWAKKGRAVDFSVEIVIYGNRQLGDQVGRILSDAEIYLQHPRCCDDYTKYNNQHYVKFKVRKPDLQPLAHSLTRPNTPEQLAPAFQIGTMLNCLDQQGNLSDGEIDRRIKTSLLRYTSLNEFTQLLTTRIKFDSSDGAEDTRKPALTLSDKKKAGGNLLFYNFGKPVAEIRRYCKSLSILAVIPLTKKLEANRYSYEHKIAGTRRSSVPPQTFGGIPADEMGLGKTLTMLSAVVGSLGMAQSFATPTHCSLAPMFGCQVSAKATLIIAPSACK
jgi:SWI/SNF-related matrix-associated actin-dependent regulator of chromatin subfamily A3